jgi:hypothetical protein
MSTRVKMPAETGRLLQAQTRLLEAEAGILAARERLMNRMVDPRRDYYKDAGYPKTITLPMYFDMYEREGAAARVVEVFPDESWAVDPDVYETVNSKDTKFEQRWQELVDEHNLYHYLHRADVLSGVGQYGGLLIGVEGGGGDLSKPVPGFVDETLPPGPGRPRTRQFDGDREIIFLLPLDQRNMKVVKREPDKASPRYGMPTVYEVAFDYTTTNDLNSGGFNTIQTAGSADNQVHWTRIQHFADNRGAHPFLGAPRQRPVFNRLQDLVKGYAGAGEMLWKGGFPGISFEALPELALNEVDFTPQDKEDLRAQIKSYMNSQQRYLSLVGFHANSLSTQVSDPTAAIMVALTNIAFTIKVPVRIFMGSEAAHLASTQDVGTWNGRVKMRQKRYLSPMVLRPFVRHLIALGCLPKPEKLFIEWPDLNTPSDRDKADIAFKKASAMQLYVMSKAWQFMTPEDFYVEIMGYKREEAKLMWGNADKIRASLRKAFPDPVKPAAGGFGGKPNNQAGSSSPNPGQGSV